MPGAYPGLVSAVYAWLGRHPRLVDGALALALALLGTPTIVGLGSRDGFLLPISAVMIIAVVFRRRNPLAAFCVAVLAGACQVLAAPTPTGTDLAIPVLLYTLAAYRPRRYSVPGLGACLAGSIVALLVWAPVQVGLADLLVAALVLFGGTSLTAWILGDSMRYRRAYYAGLEERAERLERERDARAAVAVAAERARIARELHDVIAHHVSVMVVQADGAGYAMDAEPDRARDALAAISSTGRQALAEMRRLLGILRSGDEQATLAPQPDLDQLHDLLEQARAAGMSVSLTRDGAPGPLPDGAGLAAYRVVQESLTNTRKHGGIAAAAAVTVSRRPDCLLIQVTDDGRGPAAPPDGAGHGLAGMRERVEMYGGSLRAGPLPCGGYRVTAWLPVTCLAEVGREAPEPARGAV